MLFIAIIHDDDDNDNDSDNAGRWLEKQQLEIKMWFDSYQLLCIITYHECHAKIGSYCCCRCFCGSHCCCCWCCRSVLLLGCINWPQPADLPKCICIAADNRNMHFEIVSTPVVKSDCGRPTIPKMKLNTKLSLHRHHHRIIRGMLCVAAAKANVGETKRTK